MYMYVVLVGGGGVPLEYPNTQVHQLLRRPLCLRRGPRPVHRVRGRHMCGDNEECDYLNFRGENLVCADCDEKLKNR